MDIPGSWCSEMLVVNPNDSFAGKLCAALDRQHPRDLFDVKLLLENEGIGDDLLQVFIVYLISGNRPIKARECLEGAFVRKPAKVIPLRHQMQDVLCPNLCPLLASHRQDAKREFNFVMVDCSGCLQIINIDNPHLNVY